MSDAEAPSPAPLSGVARMRAERARERALQKQRYWMFRAFDRLAVVALMVSVCCLLLAGRVLERRVDMSQSQREVLTGRLMAELAKEKQLNGQERLIALEAGLHAFGDMQRRTEPKVASLGGFVSEILFYSPERNLAVLEARNFPDRLKAQLQYMLSAPTANRDSGEPISLRRNAAPADIPPAPEL